MRILKRKFSHHKKSLNIFFPHPAAVLMMQRGDGYQPNAGVVAATMQHSLLDATKQKQI